MITVQMPMSRILQEHLRILERARRRSRRHSIYMCGIVGCELLLSIYDGLYGSELQMWMRVITIVGMTIILWVTCETVEKVDEAIGQVKKVVEIERELTRLGIPTAIEAQAKL